MTPLDEKPSVNICFGRIALTIHEYGGMVVLVFLALQKGKTKSTWKGIVKEKLVFQQKAKRSIRAKPLIAALTSCIFSQRRRIKRSLLHLCIYYHHHPILYASTTWHYFRSNVSEPRWMVVSTDQPSMCCQMIPELWLVHLLPHAS